MNWEAILVGVAVFYGWDPFTIDRLTWRELQWWHAHAEAIVKARQA